MPIIADDESSVFDIVELIHKNKCRMAWVGDSTKTGGSLKEITMINYGLTIDLSKYVNDIGIPVTRIQ